MSSHHIVREKQEPALLLLGLSNFSAELLGQLLEWSPTVITIPFVAEQLNAHEIKIDFIVSDELNEDLQSDIKLVHPQGASMIEAAMKYLIKHDYQAVNVVADDIDLQALAMFADKINVVIYTGNKKIYAVSPGFSKWKPAGEIIRILSVYLNLQFSGLRQLDEKTFITTNDGFIRLNFDGDLIFIAEDI
ncbi:thiamine pyrophosphokinase [Mucilaginibacter sp. AK015]|uniref:thiamine pyrophosphokinase n=1 Tax=Mucilaginibacter sp. AK015 TaxID=2723072 RepID=UPI0016134E52|nr:thiamine pyrophosphokinase [Mucilaginibacter sp. AK015]MBB5397867.1 thiamine pyrophosphokinase [Mucilaginibacter sp. AK015]